MKYKILSGGTRFELTVRVNEALEDGAAVHGGCSYDVNSQAWLQAVTIPDKSEIKQLREPAKKR